MTKKKQVKPIAIAIYLNEGCYLYSKELFTEKEIEAVRNSEDEDTGEWKTYIILGKDLEVECHT